MFKYPYDTTPLQGVVLKDINTALQTALVNGELMGVQTEKTAFNEGLFEVPPYIKSVAPFSHPLHLQHFDQSVFVIDTRPFTRELREGGVKVVATTEHELAVLRLLLSHYWAEHGPEDFHRINELPARAFIRLVSENIVRRLALSPMDQREIVVLTAYYYFSLFTDSAWSKNDVYRLAGKISRMTMVPADFCIQVLEKISDDVLPPIANIDGFIEVLHKYGSSTRLSMLNLGILYQILGGVWFGAAARETVAVALEHPPTWMALVYMAFTDRTYHNALLSKLVLTVDKNGLGKDFTKNLVAMLGTH